MKLSVKRGYAKHYHKLAHVLHDVECYTRRAEYSKCIGYFKNPRVGPNGEFQPPLASYDKYDHISVVVLTDGRCYIGIAKCGKKDQFNRSRGHEIAVGRAMKRAMKYGYAHHHNPVMDNYDFWINTANEPLPVGVALRDRCREELAAAGVRL